MRLASACDQCEITPPPPPSCRSRKAPPAGCQVVKHSVQLIGSLVSRPEGLVHLLADDEGALLRQLLERAEVASSLCRTRPERYQCP